MKTRNLIILLIISLAMLIYFGLCYQVLCKRINYNVDNTIKEYLGSSYEYEKIISTKKNTISVYIKGQNEKYIFEFSLNNQKYTLINIKKNN